MAVGEKRRADAAASASAPAGRARPDPEAATSTADGAVDDDMGEFEDAWAEDDDPDENLDDMEEEVIDVAAEQDGNESDDSGVHEIIDEDDPDAEQAREEAFVPGVSKLGEGQVLVADQSAYVMLHSLNMQWPCLSFDIIPDELGSERRSFPMSCILVAGSQADRPDANELTIAKLSHLCKTQQSQDPDEDSESDDDDSTDPIVESRSIRLRAGVNRVRYSALSTHCAVWLDDGTVAIYDVASHVRSLVTPGSLIAPEANAPVHVVRGHKDEGFALAWTRDGTLLSGDNAGRILVTRRDSAAQWHTEPAAFTGHQGSVEDIVASPTESNVFASCGSDGTVRIWNMASKDRKRAAITCNAHPGTDVNVISWNVKLPYLLASGADDGRWSVWDLRQFKAGTTPAPVASFDWHKDAITSIEWHPLEDSVIAVCGADDQVTLWDLSVELDAEELAEKASAGLADIPSQLMFVHMGQSDVKEVHWHPQLPSVAITTALTGVNVFKSISV